MMQANWIRGTRALMLAALPLLGCGGEQVTNPASGNLELGVVIVGEEIDSDGIVATIGLSTVRLRNGQTMERALAAGLHQVVISDLAANCMVDGSADFPVSVIRGDTARMTVTVICRRTVSLPTTLLLFVSTVGLVDPSGYLLVLDGGTPTVVSPNAVTTFPDLAPGPHLLDVSGLPANCSAPDSSITVDLPPEQTTAVRLDVTCQFPLTHGMVVSSSRGSPVSFNTRLFVRNPDGSTTLIGPFTQSLEPRVSPTGTRVAYIVFGSLFLMNIDGTNNNGYYGSVSNTIPRWSADGQRLAFSAHGTGTLHVINADGYWSPGHQSARCHRFVSHLVARWYPAGGLQPDTRGLVLRHADSRHQRRRDRMDQPQPEPGLRNSYPVWSPRVFGSCTRAPTA